MIIIINNHGDHYHDHHDYDEILNMIMITIINNHFDHDHDNNY